MIKSVKEHHLHYVLLRFFSLNPFLFTNNPKIRTNRYVIITNVNNTIHTDAN